MNKSTTITTIVILILIFSAGSFYGGMKYGQSNSLTKNQQGFQTRQFRQGGQGLRAGGIAGGSLVNGEILKKDDKSVTVKVQDGGSKIIFISDDSSVLKSTSGSIGDLQIGETITANGTANADGSINALMIQIRPAQQPRAGQSNPAGQASTTK